MRTPIIDPHPNKKPPCCIICATWVCMQCWEFRRPYASLTEPGHSVCGNCGGVEGKFLATRHSHWKAGKPFMNNGVRHRTIPTIPFMVPTIGETMSGCPAGDPCPGTGCNACCPSYDPCGKRECNSCKAETVHVPEEADAVIEPEECDWVVRMATLETPDEFCGLEVQAGNEFCPRHQAHADALVEKSPSYGKVMILPDPQETVKAGVSQYDRAQLRREAMHYTVQMFSGPVPPVDGILKVAEEIYQFLTKED